MRTFARRAVLATAVATAIAVTSSAAIVALVLFPFRGAEADYRCMNSAPDSVGLNDVQSQGEITLLPLQLVCWHVTERGELIKRPHSPDYTGLLLLSTLGWMVAGASGAVAASASAYRPPVETP